MTTDCLFAARSRQVAGRFLQTAVIVDDQARLGSEPRKVLPPGRRPRPQADSGTETSKSGPGTAANDLDAKQLINAFAELGVVCAVLIPDLGSATVFGPKDSPDTIETLGSRTS